MAPRGTARSLGSGCALPSPFSVALALTIVKSKPTGLTAREHVLQLRAYLKQEAVALSEPEPRHYLDSVGLWQQRCLAAETKCNELETHIIAVERQVKLLEQQIQKDHANQRPASPNKRKGRSSAESSRAKDAKVATAEETTEYDMEVLEDNLGDEGRNLAKYIWGLQKLCLQPESDPTAVCASLVGIAASLGVMYGAIVDRYDRLAIRTRTKSPLPTLAQTRSELACTISACTRAFVMLLMGLAGLEEDHAGRRLQASVIYECVNMFHSALAAIEAAAWQSARLQMHTEVRPDSRAVPSHAKNSAAHGIAQLLLTMVGRLEQHNAAHQKIFDGFVFVLFERVSKRLYYCTFGRHRSSSVEDDIAPSVAATDPSTTAQHDTEALAIRHEVKELVVILERVMGVAPSLMNPQAASKNARKPTRTLSLKTLAPSRARLNPLVRERLQRTLVVCMFGSKVDNDFLDVLTMPVKPASMPTLPKIEDEDVEEWYQQQVWRLVGWDLMTREDSSEWTK